MLKHKTKEHMRTITTNLYQFHELSEPAKQYAVEKAREWYEFIPCLDCYEEELESKGFKESTIHYSGFWSQGDGASFDASIDLERFLIGKYEALKGLDFSLDIISNERSIFYCHERTKQVDVTCNANFTVSQLDLIHELVDELEELRIEECRRIYRSLSNDYDYQNSYEHLSEFLEINEYEFTEEGKQF